MSSAVCKTASSSGGPEVPVLMDGNAEAAVPDEPVLVEVKEQPAPAKVGLLTPPIKKPRRQLDDLSACKA
eukprot:1102916-Lingulodinium_polyedra.AAC.1